MNPSIVLRVKYDSGCLYQKLSQELISSSIARIIYDYFETRDQQTKIFAFFLSLYFIVGYKTFMS